MEKTLISLEEEQQKIREEKEERERKEKEKKQEEFIMTKPKSDFPLYIQFKQIPKEADIPITIKACVESVDSLGFIVLTDTSSTIQVVLSKELKKTKDFERIRTYTSMQVWGTWMKDERAERGTIKGYELHVEYFEI